MIFRVESSSHSVDAARSGPVVEVVQVEVGGVLPQSDLVAAVVGVFVAHQVRVGVDPVTAATGGCWALQTPRTCRR